MKKPLEDFFKKKLGSFDLDEGWNMPSDDIWEKALPHFNQEKTKRKFGFWYWLMGAIALVALFVWINNGQQNTTVTAKNTISDKTQKNIKLHQNENQSLEINFLPPNNDLVKPSTASQEILALKKITKVELVEKETNTKEISVENRISGFSKERLVDLGVVHNNIEIAKLNFKPIIKELKNDIENKPIRIIEKLPLLSLGVLYPEVVEIPVLTPKLHRIIKNPKWAISFLYAPSMSRLDIVPLDEKKIQGSRKYQFSNNFEVRITRYVSKHWGLYSGVGLITINSKTKTKESVIYDQSTERVMSNDLVANDISFETESPLGDFRMSTMITRPSAVPVPLGDVVDAYLVNNQMVSYLKVPVGLRYENRFTSKFSGYTKFGADVSFLLRDRTTTSVRVMHDLDEMGMESMTMSRISPLYKTVLSFDVGIGVERVLRPRLSGFIDINYRHSLSPVIKSVRHKTDISSFQLNVGFRYSF